MSDLIRRIDDFAQAQVLCLGDVMLDRFISGSVDRISPEAPIPVLRVEREQSVLGGVGNVAGNLAALGVRAVLLSAIGDDGPGRALCSLAEESLGTAAGLVAENGRCTTVKTRYLANHQQLLRADEETLAPLGAAAEARLLDAVRSRLPDAGAVVLSDYGKGVLTPGLLTAIIAAARSADVPVIVDPKGSDYSRYAGADLVTPNRRELSQATGLPVGNDEEVVAACRSLIARHGFKAVVATRSEQGMTVVAADGQVSHLATQAREVFDVSGAGDTVVAVLAAGLAIRLALPDAAVLANAAAGIVVGKVGTAVTRAEELKAALSRGDWEGPAGKVLPLDALVERVRLWRRRGQRIGFTNGCFDLLHPGHVSLLEQAKAACDRLVVGLNSDSSVARLKGPTRPVQSEAARGVVLASLAAVDGVVVFSEDTPMRLIEAIRPDVLVKGADYSLAQVVGAELVQSYGGKVVLAQLVAGQSTTNTLKRVQG
jgi:D-beta-D-heptose 7-phosphate kinase/D-beta-D-heptose 1-phosphate adenosyltransferase